MNDHIPGTPLKTLTWNRETGNIKIVFRENTDEKTKRQFLNCLLWKIEDTLNLGN